MNEPEPPRPPTGPRTSGAGALWAAAIVLPLVVLQACGRSDVTSQPTVEAATPSTTSALLAVDVSELSIDAGSFGCLADMTNVRHFYVDNLLGDVDATVAVAESTDGGVYPPGSVVQLVPTEAMVKLPPGSSPATRDWEFFELEVTGDGSRIVTRGFADVENRFGGNCFGCHIEAEPQYDLICELDHGCDPIPVTREQIAAVQAADPRCSQ